MRTRYSGCRHIAAQKKFVHDPLVCRSAVGTRGTLGPSHTARIVSVGTRQATPTRARTSPNESTQEASLALGFVRGVLVRAARGRGLARGG